MKGEAMSLEGKCALVTGAGGGIGRAAALALARAGAAVAVHYFRNRDGAQATVEAMAGAGPARAIVVAGDLSRPDEARRVVDTVEQAFGRIDVLVNNAGDLVQRRPLVEMTPELWRQVLDTN